VYLRQAMPLNVATLLRFPALLISIAACGGTATPAQPPQATAVHTLDDALAGSWRSAQNKARDGFRHPKETLTFFGIKNDMHVVELWPGGGWYTEVLAPFLRDTGKLTVTNFDPQTAQEPMKGFAVSYEKKLAASPDLFGKVEVRHVTPPNDVNLGPNESADIVLTFRNFHNWIQGGFDKNVVDAAFKVLKHGGVFGVVEHRADPGTDDKTTKDTGYVPEQRIVDLAQAAGFKLDGKSDVNANPKDDHKHENGVWALPPVLRNGDKDKDKYLAIGESDRMTLKFVKP
jgi:predicted methyltransferase